MTAPGKVSVTLKRPDCVVMAITGSTAAKATAVQVAKTIFSYGIIRQAPGGRVVLTGEMTMGRIIWIN